MPLDRLDVAIVAGDVADVAVPGGEEMGRGAGRGSAVVDVEDRVAVIADDLVADQCDRHASRDRRHVAVARNLAGEQDDAVDLPGEDEAGVVRLLLRAVSGCRR